MSRILPKIVHLTGIVARILPLLNSRTTRYVGLEALSTVTHHGGVDARKLIAKEATPALIRLMQELPDDIKANDLAIATISHAVGAVINEQHVTKSALRSLDIPSILRLLLANMRKPDAPFHLLTHGHDFLTSATLHCHQEIKAIPPIVSLIVSALRSNDLSTRCGAMASLVRLNNPDSEEDHRHFDPQAFIGVVSRGIPLRLSELCMDYGPTKCEMTLTLSCTRDFQAAMMRCAQDHDLYALGRVIGELITRTEFSVTEGGFQVKNEKTGALELADCGLPFKMWHDSLPHCAKALRRNGSRSDLDMADIIDLKYLVIRSRIPEAIELAKKAIERNPHVAYFYYIIGLGADRNQALRSVKKGLKAKYTTPFVRLYSLWRAVEHAGDLGLTMLASASTGDAEYVQGVAFLMSALDDAKAFVSEAPPDARHLHTVLNWYIILSVAISGPDLSLDFRELDVRTPHSTFVQMFC